MKTAALILILALGGCCSTQEGVPRQSITCEGRSLELFRTDTAFLRDGPEDLGAFAHELKTIARMTGGTNDYVVLVAKAFESAYQEMRDSLSVVEQNLEPGDSLFFYRSNNDPEDRGKLILNAAGRVKWIRRETFE